MASADTFSQQITDFERYGTYTYEFDEVGNVVLNSASVDFSQVYLAFGLSNFTYDDAKIKSFYDPAFVEFVSQPTASATQPDASALQAQLQETTAQNAALTTQLNSLIEQTSATPAGTTNDLAVKQVILELRKALGQGRVDSDFADTFPYAPVKKTTSIISSTPGSTVSTNAVITSSNALGSGGANVDISSGLSGVIAGGGGGVFPLPPTGGGTIPPTGGGTTPPTGGGTPPVTPPVIPPGRGAPGGCFLAGTKIRMADGSTKLIENVIVGDQLASLNLPYVTVLELKPNTYHSYYIINGKLNVTWEHPIWVSQIRVGNNIQDGLKIVRDLKIGDNMIHYDGTLEPIATIVPVTANIPTYNFIVDGNHLYVAEDIVVHNPTLVQKY